MKKKLVIDQQFGKDAGLDNFISLLPAYGNQPYWHLPFEKHTDYNREVISAKYQLAELFSKKIYSPKLGYNVESCKSLFLNCGGLITFVIADRILRINRLLAEYSPEELQLPQVDFKHNVEVSYEYMFYNEVESDPFFNQWLINELLPSVKRITIQKEESNFTFVKIKRHDIGIRRKSLIDRAFSWLKKNLLNEEIPLKNKINKIIRPWKIIYHILISDPDSVIKKILIKIAYKKGNIAWDNIGPVASTLSQKIYFFWPWGKLAPFPYSFPSVPNQSTNIICREDFRDLSTDVATIFMKMIEAVEEEIRLPFESFNNIGKIISELIPACTTEFSEFYCKWILDEFSRYKNKSFFCGGTYYGHVGAMRLFACRELDIKVIATQHSAWGGYLANGPLISEVLISGCDDYISFGWTGTPDDGSSTWRNRVISMPSPLISEMQKNAKKSDLVQPLKKHVLFCPGFLYRFPSIYNSFLRWDIVNEWAAVIEDVIQKVCASGVKISLKMYDQIMAENQRAIVGKWLKAGGSNIIEHTNHNASVRGMLLTSEFEKEYDAVIWDIPTGGFTEAIACGRKTFALWNENLIRPLPEGKPFIKDLLKNGVFFSDGDSLTKSLNSFYQTAGWFETDPVKSSIDSFMNRFLKTDENWETHWKKLFDEM